MDCYYYVLSENGAVEFQKGKTGDVKERRDGGGQWAWLGRRHEGPSRKGRSRLQQARDLPSRFAVGLSDYGLYGPQRRIPGEREGLLPVRPIRSWTAQIVITPHYSSYTVPVWFILVHTSREFFFA